MSTIIPGRLSTEVFPSHHT